MAAWSLEDVHLLYKLPFFDLLYQAHSVHIKNFPKNRIQISTLVNIKTGGCSEDCAYCGQSRHMGKGKCQPPMELCELEELINKAKERRATRLCMGAAWRSPRGKDLEKVCEMIKLVKSYDLESCVTLGFLAKEQVAKLKEAGLDYYNHNIDTSFEYYKEIVTTHTFEDRLKTIQNVQDAGIKICCGGILGMGESVDDRLQMLTLLANFKIQPQSVPINRLIPIKGTPLENEGKIDNFDFIRIIALARIMMEKSYVRLSAGRESMSEEMQALCFFAGANSIFYGEKLLTAENAMMEKDDDLLARLGLCKC